MLLFCFFLNSCNLHSNLIIALLDCLNFLHILCFPLSFCLFWWGYFLSLVFQVFYWAFHSCMLSYFKLLESLFCSLYIASSSYFIEYTILSKNITYWLTAFFKSSILFSLPYFCFPLNFGFFVCLFNFIFGFHLRSLGQMFDLGLFVYV